MPLPPDASEPWTPSTISRQDGIINGRFTAQNFSYVGALLKFEKQTNQKEGRIVSICTGTLIRNNVVLTAAHCMNKSRNTSIQTAWVFTLDPNLVDETLVNDWWNVEAIQIHPNFSLNFCNPAITNPEQIACSKFKDICKVDDTTTNDQIKDCYARLSPEQQESINFIPLRPVYDLALAYLTTEKSPTQQLPNVQGLLPQRSMEENFTNATPVYIAGYGKQYTSETTTLDSESESVDAKFYGRTTIFNFSSENLEVGVGLNESKTCFGDSGGPAMLQQGNMQSPGDADDLVIGVTSRARDLSGDCQNGSIFSRVDTEINWIDQSITRYYNPPSEKKQGCQNSSVEHWLGGLSLYIGYWLYRQKTIHKPSKA